MDKIVSGKTYKSRLTKRLHMHRQQSNNTGDAIQYSSVDRDFMDQDIPSERHGHPSFGNPLHDNPERDMQDWPLRSPAASNSSSTFGPNYSVTPTSLYSSSLYSSIPCGPKINFSRKESLREIPLEGPFELKLPKRTSSLMHVTRASDEQGAPLLHSKLSGIPRQLDSYHTRTDPFYEYPSLQSTVSHASYYSQDD